MPYARTAHRIVHREIDARSGTACGKLMRTALNDKHTDADAHHVLRSRPHSGQTHARMRHTLGRTIGPFPHPTERRDLCRIHAEQLDGVVASLKVTLTEEDVSALESAYKAQPIRGH